ncbi:MAG: hypothetical protein FJ279_22900 [Planctomycetes bacterium]|nr:hypothetical protein [Planctomycetota bacterium]
MGEWGDGEMGQWDGGGLPQHSNTPSLHYSNIPFSSPSRLWGWSDSCTVRPRLRPVELAIRLRQSAVQLREKRVRQCNCRTRRMG